MSKIVEMAREAGLGGLLGDPVFTNWNAEVERFAALVAKAERERCALIANAARDGYADRGVNLMACAADYIVCAIRALGDEVGGC